MIIQAKLKLNNLIISGLSSVGKISRSRSKFILEIMFLFLSIKDKLNFLQFGRYGKYREQRYRNQFEKPFDFLNFNKSIIVEHSSQNIAIAFDPSYISKSGTKTYGKGKFWSGVASQAKLGLEIGGIAAIDIDNNTAMHLEAVQTPSKSDLSEKSMTLVDWYADILVGRKDYLKSLSNYIVADGYFSKKPFVDKITTQAQMHVISRLRTDADLRYLYKGEKTGKRGRPKKYTGKVIWKNIDKEYFELIEQTEDTMIYQARLYSKSLKRIINVVLEVQQKTKQKGYIIFFSTDLEMKGITIRKIYKSRFQIEFLYRDAKQYTGLESSQARSENKLHFHFNASLSAVNLAKVLFWYSLPQEIRKKQSFSMRNAKNQFNSILMLEIFFKVFAIKPKLIKNDSLFDKWLNFANIT